jgi:CheY-like chemotaxis protein/predicted XRE-type DNA-binding protein
MWSLIVYCEPCYFDGAIQDFERLLVQEIDIKKTFGSSVRSWRKQLGLSQEELAERSDLHRTYISDVERGARNLSLESMTRLARALEIPVAALFPPESPGGEAGAITNHGQNREFVDILLVEDNADDVALTLHAFKQARFANHVLVVSDGAEALDCVFCRGKYSDRRPEMRPQVVLLDLNLPKVSGLEVLRQIKADERTRLIPVVVLTVSEMFRDFEECERLGAESYIIKPLNFHRLSQITPRLNLDWALLKPDRAGLQPVVK